MLSSLANRFVFRVGTLVYTVCVVPSNADGGRAEVGTVEEPSLEKSSRPRSRSSDGTGSDGTGSDRTGSDGNRRLDSEVVVHLEKLQRLSDVEVLVGRVLGLERPSKLFHGVVARVVVHR